MFFRFNNGSYNLLRINAIFFGRFSKLLSAAELDEIWKRPFEEEYTRYKDAYVSDNIQIIYNESLILK